MFRYDVFRVDNFTSHLHDALRRHSFEVFHDTSLPRGQSIAPNLLQAINQSQIYVVVFSTHYADSKWCLDELSQMMHCMHNNHQQILLPVFFDSHVHAPFQQLIAANPENQDKVQKWREALHEAGELPGLHLQDHANGDENKLLDQVVEKLRKMLHREPNLNAGIESRSLSRGSRIIVTTRDGSNVVDRDAIYEPRLLDEKESLEVFCLDAFGQDHPKKGYEEVSREAVGWGAGCPGVLKALAVCLRRHQTAEEWGCVLRCVKHNPSYLMDGSSL